MVQITRDEMESLRQHSLRRFDDGLIEHIARYFARHYRLMGTERVRSLVIQGRKAALVYGLETEREIYLYVSLMLYLGSNFDTDPQLPWAQARLTDGGIPSPWRRIETAFDEGLAYLDLVLGVETELFEDAARRVPQGLDYLIAASSEGGLLDTLHWVGLDHNSAHPRHAATSVSAGRVTGRGRRRRAGGGRPTCASTWSNSAG